MILQGDILRLARRAGACVRIRDLEQAKTDHEVAQLMFKHFDFCAEKHFPPNIFCVKHEKILAQNGIYVNACADLQGHGKYALIGTTRATLNASDYAIIIVYLKDMASLHIKASNHAIVLVEAYDSAEVALSLSDQSRATIILRNNAQLHCDKTNGYLRIINHKDGKGTDIQD
jgi:hypothetical protein